MKTEITPLATVEAPAPDRIASVTMSGCEFEVGYGFEEGEPATWCDEFVSVHASKALAWVECVKLGGKWWNAIEVFESDFCDQLDAALSCQLEGAGAA